MGTPICLSATFTTGTTFEDSCLYLWKTHKEVHFWPGLGLPRPKAIVVIPKNQPLPKYLRTKASKSAKYHRPLRYEKKTG